MKQNIRIYVLSVLRDSNIELNTKIVSFWTTSSVFTSIKAIIVVYFINCWNFKRNKPSFDKLYVLLKSCFKIKNLKKLLEILYRSFK